jgi:hypothetical protein
MSLLRVVAPVLIGFSIASVVNGNAAGITSRSGAVMQGSDSDLRCDPNSLTAEWAVSEDDPGFVESVLIRNIANTCDGGTLYVVTDTGPASPAITIPVGASTQLDVSLGLRVESLSSLSVVILAPSSL